MLTCFSSILYPFVWCLHLYDTCIANHPRCLSCSVICLLKLCMRLHNAGMQLGQTKLYKPTWNTRDCKQQIGLTLDYPTNKTHSHASMRMRLNSLRAYILHSYCILD